VTGLTVNESRIYQKQQQYVIRLF